LKTTMAKPHRSIVRSRVAQGKKEWSGKKRKTLKRYKRRGPRSDGDGKPQKKGGGLSKVKHLVVGKKSSGDWVKPRISCPTRDRGGQREGGKKGKTQAAGGSGPCPGIRHNGF